MKFLLKLGNLFSYGMLLTVLLIGDTVPVFADAVAPTGASGSLGSSSAVSQGVLLAVFILVFYVLIIRPQNKRAKEQRNLITGLQKGDEVLTSSGIIGKITKSADSFFVIQIAEGIEVLMQKQAIVGSVPKGTMKSV